MNKAIIAVAAVVVLAVGGWLIFGRDNSKNTSSPAPSSSSNTSTTQSNTSNTQSSENSNSQTPSASNSVTIQNFAFSPANLTVKKGTAVTWTNKDSTTHTVTENDGQTGPSSGNLTMDKTYSFTFNTTGTFKYHCSIHPDMTGTVVVTE